MTPLINYLTDRLFVLFHSIPKHLHFLSDLLQTIIHSVGLPNFPTLTQSIPITSLRYLNVELHLSIKYSLLQVFNSIVQIYVPPILSVKSHLIIKYSLVQLFNIIVPI